MTTEQSKPPPIEVHSSEHKNYLLVQITHNKYIPTWKPNQFDLYEKTENITEILQYQLGVKMHELVEGLMQINSESRQKGDLYQTCGCRRGVFHAKYCDVHTLLNWLGVEWEFGVPVDEVNVTDPSVLHRNADLIYEDTDSYGVLPYGAVLKQALKDMDNAEIQITEDMLDEIGDYAAIYQASIRDKIQGQQATIIFEEESICLKDIDCGKEGGHEGECDDTYTMVSVEYQPETEHIHDDQCVWYKHSTQLHDPRSFRKLEWEDEDKGLSELCQYEIDDCEQIEDNDCAFSHPLQGKPYDEVAHLVDNTRSLRRNI